VALRPVRLEPLFVPRIWGARSLAPLFPEKNSLAEPVGEVWLTGDDCRFADGPFTGERLGDAWQRMGEEWTGRLANRHRKKFPVLAKFLFPEDKLSVQVHPDDDYASRHEVAAGGIGKTEMWYVVSARPEAEVRVGLKRTVNADEFRCAIGDGTAEDLVERIPVQSGDAIFVPAGTVHTIGPGMVLCEIQQNSDLTYRVHDFGRVDARGKPRELHIEKALDVIRFGDQCGGKVSPRRSQDAMEEGTLLVECPYFTVVKHEFEGTVRTQSSGKLELLVFLEGNGSLNTHRNETSVEYSRAQTWLVPCALSELALAAKEPTKMLRVTAPSF
jgi:mannose-6-phosphate isomerase